MKPENTFCKYIYDDVISLNEEYPANGIDAKTTKNNRKFITSHLWVRTDAEYWSSIYHSVNSWLNI